MERERGRVFQETAREGREGRADGGQFGGIRKVSVGGGTESAGRGVELETLALLS